MDLTPATPAGRMAFQSYGGGRFRISGEIFESAILLIPEACRPWQAADAGDLDPESLKSQIDSLVADAEAEIAPEILIVGCGARFAAPPKGFRQAMKDRGLTVEWMDTGAACRTFNLLMSEGRAVAAAVLAID